MNCPYCNITTSGNHEFNCYFYQRVNQISFQQTIIFDDIMIQLFYPYNNLIDWAMNRHT